MGLGREVGEEGVEMDGWRKVDVGEELGEGWEGWKVGWIRLGQTLQKS